MRRFSLVHRYRCRMHFFPMLLPLVEIVPLLLAGVGAVAAATGSLWHRRRLVVVVAGVLSLVSFAGAGVAVYLRTPDKIVRYDGTKEILPDAYPKLMRYAEGKEMPATPPWKTSMKYFPCRLKTRSWQPLCCRRACW